MDARRIGQFAVLVVALGGVAFGVVLMTTARARFGVACTMIALVIGGVAATLLLSGRGGSPVAQAPGHGVRLAERHLLHDSVAGVAGAASYELDLYGSARPGTALAAELGRALATLGYRPQQPTPGPVLQTNAAELAQFALDRWRWRVFELTLPTRFAGVDYTTRDVAHLVAVTLSDDGSSDAVPFP